MGRESGAGPGAARRGSVQGALLTAKEEGHSFSPVAPKSRWPISHMSHVSQELTGASELDKSSR